MIGGLRDIRNLCTRPAEAVRWACVLEATAPKPGNVFPGHDFADLSYYDFVKAAELSTTAFSRSPTSFSHAVLDASIQVADQIGTNVNLGILLLIGPLFQADSFHADSNVTPDRICREDLRTAANDILSGLTIEDSDLLYRAINVAGPGGMGETTEMDLAGPAPESFLAAMKSAASRDRIALNYSSEYLDLFQTVVPILEICISQTNDLLSGIVAAQLRLLASAPDSLIVRKFGPEVAHDVQLRANFDHDNGVQRGDFSRFLDSGARDLKGRTSRLNPGTTADLIAGGLYVLLRESIL